MAYLIPPMEDEPPPEFVAFVAARWHALHAEAARLVGGDRAAFEISMQVLTDVAGQWRWLSWWRRLTHREAAGGYLDRRLTARTKQWREERIYPVEVQVIGYERKLEPAGAAVAQYRRRAHESVAEQLASLLPSTVRTGTGVIADAGIAWVHAYRRYLWRRYWGMAGGMVLLIGSIVQFMSQFSAAP